MLYVPIFLWIIGHTVGEISFLFTAIHSFTLSFLTNLLLYNPTSNISWISGFVIKNNLNKRKETKRQIKYLDPKHCSMNEKLWFKRKRRNINTYKYEYNVLSADTWDAVCSIEMGWNSNAETDEMTTMLCHFHCFLYFFKQVVGDDDFNLFSIILIYDYLSV